MKQLWIAFCRFHNEHGFPTGYSSVVATDIESQTDLRRTNGYLIIDGEYYAHSYNTGNEILVDGGTAQQFNDSLRVSQPTFPNSPIILTPDDPKYHLFTEKRLQNR